jgi:LPXTG-motif cell wall-anchored protein
MLFTTLVAVTALCLMIPFTRMYGVIGAVITLYFYPTNTLTVLGVLLLTGAAFYYIQRRKSHA